MRCLLVEWTVFTGSPNPWDQHTSYIDVMCLAPEGQRTSSAQHCSIGVVISKGRTNVNGALGQQSIRAALEKCLSEQWGGMHISHLTNDEKTLLTICNVLKWNLLPPRSGDVQTQSFHLTALFEGRAEGMTRGGGCILRAPILRCRVSYTCE